MNKHKQQTWFRVLHGLAAAVAIASFAPACADLAVVNLNDPDLERAVSSPSDVEALISGGFQELVQRGSRRPSGPCIQHGGRRELVVLRELWHARRKPGASGSL